MRLAISIALSICIAATAEAKPARIAIISDIEMSEWTPPMKLSLDFSSGRYSIAPPAAPWPAIYGKPQPRNGRITGEKLVSIRLIFDHAFAVGVSDQKCVANNAKGYDFFFSNGGVAQMSLTVDGKRIITPKQYACWTAAARALHKALQQNFDDQSPS